jgi:hypothetical protein
MTFVKLLQVFSDEVCLHAVCETNAKLAEATMVEIPQGVRIYEDYEEFLNSGIDAVVLCNFFHEHASFAIKALDKVDQAYWDMLNLFEMDREKLEAADKEANPVAAAIEPAVWAEVDAPK